MSQPPGQESEPATTPQREYALKQGLAFPSDITKAAMSDLIRRAVDGDGNPTPGLIDFARAQHLEFSSYIGERALYNQLFHFLSEAEKVRFFVFSVYRWLSGDLEPNPEATAHRERVAEVARRICADPRALKSIHRYHGEASCSSGSEGVRAWFTGEEAT